MSAPSETAPLLRGGGSSSIEPAGERAPRSPPILSPGMVNRQRVASASLNVTPHPHPHPHLESHTDYSAILRDIIIGFADGLTVPFALTAGLSSLGSTKLVVIGGLAELFSGMISMGLGAYLAAVTEREHWEAENAREAWEVDNVPDMERAEIFEILSGYGISRAAAQPITDELCADKKNWVRFMMDFELKLEEPDVSRAWISALTMGLSYFIGGLVPMIPYFVLDSARHALYVSIGVTVVILLVFGYVKNYITIRNKKAGVLGALQTLIIGALAAGTSYAIVRLLDSGDAPA